MTDENGDPIIGATVLEKGTNNGVISDVNGRYTIKVPSNAVLQLLMLVIILKKKL